MENLSPHRRFVDPRETKGIPEVQRHTPVPQRDQPLPGTKRLRCPTDDHLNQVLDFHPVLANDELSRAAMFTGRSALVFAVIGVAAMFTISWLVRLGADRDHLYGWLLVAAVLVHLLAAMSQMLSDWRSQAGGWALVIIYVGGIAKMVISGLLAIVAGV